MQPRLCYRFSKDPKLCPCSPCTVFTQFLGMREDKTTLPPLPFLLELFCSARTRGTLRTLPVLEGKTLRGICLVQNGLIWKKTTRCSSFHAGKNRHLGRGHDLVLHLIPGHGEGNTGWIFRGASHPGPIPLPRSTAEHDPAENLWCFLVLSRGNQVPHFSVPFSIALELSSSPAKRRMGARGDNDWEMLWARARAGVFSLLPVMSSEPPKSTRFPWAI